MTGFWARTISRALAASPITSKMALAVLYSWGSSHLLSTRTLIILRGEDRLQTSAFLLYLQLLPACTWGREGAAVGLTSSRPKIRGRQGQLPRAWTLPCPKKGFKFTNFNSVAEQVITCLESSSPLWPVWIAWNGTMISGEWLEVKKKTKNEWLPKT